MNEKGKKRNKPVKFKNENVESGNGNKTRINAKKTVEIVPCALLFNNERKRVQIMIDQQSFPFFSSFFLIF